MGCAQVCAEVEKSGLKTPNGCLDLRTYRRRTRHMGGRKDDSSEGAKVSNAIVYRLPSGLSEGSDLPSERETVFLIAP